VTDESIKININNNDEEFEDKIKRISAGYTV
jgi:hypothetical protein